MNQTDHKGKSKRWSDEEKALLALLLLIDFEDARRLWTRYAGVYGGLIDAVAFANRDALTGSPGFWFDIEQQRYAIGRRGYIPVDAINLLAENIRRRAEEDVSILAAQVSAGIIPIEQFQTAMVDLLKPLAVAVTALGKGGLFRVDDDDKQAVVDKLLLQLIALDRFALQIEQHAPHADTPEAVIRRSRAYVGDTFQILPDRQRASHVLAEFIEEISILAPAEHCRKEDPPHELPDCVTLAGLSWQPIGTIPLPGLRKCLWNCRCKMEFRRAAAIQRGVA